jgi:hypothetical protein
MWVISEVLHTVYFLFKNEFIFKEKTYSVQNFWNHPRRMASLQNEMEMRFYFQVVLSEIFWEIEGFIEPHSSSICIPCTILPSVTQ